MRIDEAAFRAFKESTFGSEYMIWHDGLYTGGVSRLTGEARAHALAMLRFGLSIGDAHAAEALAAMGDDGARDAMLASMTGADGATVVRTALAAHALRAEPGLAAHLVRVLESGEHWSVRIDAAIGLRHFRGAEDERALLDRVEHDVEYLVRYHASESLLARWKVKRREINAHPAIFALISTPSDGAPSKEHLAGYARARAALLALRTTSR